jgi:hypothetical protein
MKRTVCASTTSTRSSAGHSRRATGGTSFGSSLTRAVVTTEPVSGNVLPCTVGRVSPIMRCGPKLNATSSAVMTSPLWNRTPGRSVASTVRSSIRRQLVARPGFCSSALW